MKESVHVNWVEGMSFEVEVGGYKIMIDSEPESGGIHKGPKPKPLMMVALAGCTGMDVVALLRKMRVDFEAINITVEGDLAEEHPRKFNKMHVIFEIKGKNLDLTKIEKALALSKDKYCGVSASYKDIMELTYEIRMVE